jgi:SAM-dependent methyltransferase
MLRSIRRITRRNEVASLQIPVTPSPPATLPVLPQDIGAGHIIDFRFLTLEDQHDYKYSAWSRVYEYPYVLNTLVKLGATSESKIHNTSWGFGGCHVCFKDDLDSLYPRTLHTDIKSSTLPNTGIYDITANLPEFKNKFDFVLNVSTVEEVCCSPRSIINNILDQVAPGGHLIITFDYNPLISGYGSGTIALHEVEELVRQKISQRTPNAITSINSICPNPIHSGLYCGVLVIKKV